MLYGLHILLTGVFAALPLAMLGWALHRWRKGRLGLLISLAFTAVAGIGLGAGLAYLNGRLMGGRVSAWEIAQLIYFVIAFLCLLKLFDMLSLRGIFRALRVPVDSWGRPLSQRQPRALAGLVGQRVVMMLLIASYAFALLLVYRPKVVTGLAPKQLGLVYAEASFASEDGIWLSGWWIPARPRAEAGEMAAEGAVDWGKRTVLVCHSVGSGKERQLGLAWMLASRGYNVMLFDFRGHGSSGGHFISYGDRERYDVLGAVQWIKANHAGEAERLIGFGATTGAAALLGAAAEEPKGRMIDGLILVQPYARFGPLAAETAERVLPWGLRWLAQNLSLPLASLHAGSNLIGFAPVEYVARLWPRPLLVIHGRGETFIPVFQEMEVYQAALQPKEQFWPTQNYRAQQAKLKQARDETRMLITVFRQWLGLSDTLYLDGGVQYRLFSFLREAEPVPAL